MSLRANIVVLAVICVTVASFGCKEKAPGTGTPASGGETSPPAGETPPAGFAMMDASAFNVADYKGKVLVMDFWATWCGPCKMEIPHLIELQKQYQDRGLQVIGITFDDNPDEAVPKYAAEVGINYPNVRGTDKLKSEYAVIGLPTIVIYDRNGNKVMSRAGYIEKSELEGKILPLLNAAPPK